MKSNSFWRNKKILVTGGSGFIGSHTVEALLANGADVTVSVRNSGATPSIEHLRPKIKIVTGDLQDSVFCADITHNMDAVFHLAATVGGIEFNRKNHSLIFRDNMQMSINILEASRKAGVERFLLVSSACVYSLHTSLPTSETEGFQDSPEPTNEGYGWAKRMSEYLAQTYAKEHNMRIAIARPCNVYGPRHKLDPERSHVIAALIRKVLDGNDPLIVWGSGDQTRSFIYVKDLAQGLLAMAEKYAQADPVNLCSQEEFSVKDLARIIIKLAGASPKVIFDVSRPDGYPRRLYDNKKAQKLLGFEAQTTLESGLRQTIEWHSHQLNASTEKEFAS